MDTIEIIDTDPTVTVTAGSTLSITDPAETIKITPAQEVIEIFQPATLKLTDGNVTGINPYLDESIDTTVISGIAAIRGLARVDLSWVEQTIPAHHGRTQVWRSTINDVASAICVGDSQTQSLTDTVDPSVAYYYWFIPVSYYGTSGSTYGSHYVNQADTTALEAYIGITGLQNELLGLETTLNQAIVDAGTDAVSEAETNLNAQIALINTRIDQIVSDLNQALAALEDSTDTSYDGLTTLITSVSDANSSLVSQLTDLSTSIASDTATINSSITLINTSYVDLNTAIANQSISLNASIDSQNSSLSALIDIERDARVADGVASASITTSLQSQITDEVADRQAAITQEALTRVTNESATATLVNTISSGFTTAENTLNARITEEATTLATANSALATSLTALETDFVGQLGSSNASVTTQIEAFSSENEAFASQLQNLDAAVTTVNGTVSAQVTKLDEVKATADGTSSAVSSIETRVTDEEGKSAAATLQLESINNDIDGLTSRAFLGVDVNDRITGIEIFDGTSSHIESTINLMGDKVNIINPTSFTPFVSFNTSLNYAEFAGQIRLRDGTVIGTSGDLTVGGDGDTIYFEEEYSIDGTTSWHFPPVDGDNYKRVQQVINTVGQGWGAAFRFTGTDGSNGTNGSDGATGPQGPNGNNGTNGIDGIDGSNGLGSLPFPINPAVLGGTGDLTFVINDNNTTPDPGEITILGSKFNHPDGTLRTVTTQAVLTPFGDGSKAGTFYLMWSDQDVTARYPALAADGLSAGNFIAVEYANDIWRCVSNTATTVPANLIATDCILCACVSEAVNGGITGIVSFVGGSVGVDGPAGQPGAGFYSLTLRDGVFPDNVTASVDFLSNWNRAPTQDDHLTYRNADGTVVSIKRYDGTVWVTPSAVFSGDVIAKGTVSGDRFAAGTEITAPIIKGGKFELIGSAFMKVEDANGFGPDGLWYWFGPKILTGNDPNYSLLTKANAKEWKDTNGNSYFGGNLSAGVFSNGRTSTDKTLLPSITVGPFGTNGSSKVLNVTFSMTGGQFSTSTCPVSPVQPTATVILERSINGGAFSTVQTMNLTGTTTAEQEGVECTTNESISGTINWTDTNSSTDDFTYRATVTSQTRYHQTANISSQILSVLSVEA